MCVYIYIYAYLYVVSSSYSSRYVLRVRASRPYLANLVKEQEIWVQNTEKEPEVNNTIKMEVGIEDCLHIEFEYRKSK